MGHVSFDGDTWGNVPASPDAVLLPLIVQDGFGDEAGNKETSALIVVLALSPAGSDVRGPGTKSMTD